jgi:phosphatidylethanolamine/phosphatidyl-N-methylethanolamine N-methyltransferase
MAGVPQTTPDARAARRRPRRAPVGDRQIGIGAVLPSGGKVARGMAREIDLARPGTVLELGGGTGGVTRGLIDAGCPVERLAVIEREPDLARYLERRFPRLHVLCGDACDVAALLDGAGIQRLAAVLSSLPIKWFPRGAQRAVLEGCFARLGDGGCFVQLTNSLASPLPAADLGLEGEEVLRIWAHFLPVQIWRYRRRAAGAGRC